MTAANYIPGTLFQKVYAQAIDSTDNLISGSNPLPITGTVTANAGTNLNTSALATSANQLPDNHNVIVSNMNPPVETGLATSANQINGDQLVQVVGIDWVSGKSGIDKATETLQNITYEHHEIHAGSHYFICGYETGLANNDTVEYVVTTPDTTKWSHMLYEFVSTLGFSLDVYEGASNVVGGTSVTAYNNDRNSANTSSLIILKDPISITNGTMISGYLAGANRVSGFSSRDKELILKQNTIYLFRFTSLANNNALSVCGEWYEHTNKN